MKLEQVQVQYFKSIRDSEPFAIDEKITCFVGKNESGKTAILQAIAKLNPLIGDGAFYPLEYPRDIGGGPAPDVGVLTTTWNIDPNDVAAVNGTLGDGVIQPQKITIEKGYYNDLRWTVVADPRAALKHLLAKHPVADHKHVSAAGTIPGAIEALSDRPDKTPADTDLLAALKTAYPNGEFIKAVVTLLTARLPKMVYVPDYFRMPGQVAIDDLKARQAANTLEEKHRVFLAFLDFAGVTTDDLINTSQYEPLIAKLEWASNQITKEIFAYWTQNRHLRVRVTFDFARSGDPAPFNAGYIVRTRVENTRHNVSVGFDERSAGFVWFFSFLVWFSQARKNYGDNLIILLDEPGLSLHAKAQADLLRYIEEKLTIPPYQVLYSTHSPFLVDPQQLHRVRTVEDVWIEPKEGTPSPAENELGTKVGHEVLSTDRDTVFPLQAALGYEITQTLFVGPNTLLVEGPSEILYLQWFSKRLGTAGLDRRWTICPCGGVDKIPAFLSLFSGNKLNIAVLADLATGQKRKIEDLRKSRLLAAGRVLTCDTFASQAEADIEDVVGRPAYIELVNRTYELTDRALPATPSATAPLRVVKEVEAHFAVLPPDAPAFDHYDPASFLIQQAPNIALTGIDEATERFRTLFTALNAYLPA